VGIAHSAKLNRRCAVVECSFFVLDAMLAIRMAVETLKDALSAGWRVHVKCIGGKVDNGKSVAKCVNQRELDLETLVWTRGRNMPISMMSERMMCPRWCRRGSG
jgi:hypothetical protein